MKFDFAALPYREGSPAHALDLAACMNESLCGIGPTDGALARAALRSYAGRGRRRASAALVAVGMVATLAIVGVEDRDRNGRADLSDLIAAGRIAFAEPLDTKRPIAFAAPDAPPEP